MTAFGTEPGWFGSFTRERAAGAVHGNGARIVKTFCEEGDGTPLGTLGTVLGSVDVPQPHATTKVGYFVEWDNRRKWAVFVADFKIGAVS